MSGDAAQENGSGAAGGDTRQRSNAEVPGKDDDRKLFVGGLSWETTEKELREYFGAFGEIESVNVKTDAATGRSRGFAFLVFTTTEAIEKVMAKTDHVIGGKKVDPKKAKSRHGKIFVGGLKPEMTDEDIKSHFSAMGTVVEVEMPMDKVKNQRKGFCFITFEQEQVVQDLIKSGKTTIKGFEVDVKKATPKPDGGFQRGGFRGGFRGGPGRGRGGRGGWGGWGGGYGGGYGGYGGGYDAYGGYGGYGGYDPSYGYGGGYDGYGGGYGGGYDYSGYGGGYGGGKQRGGSRGGARHQPY